MGFLLILFSLVFGILVFVLVDASRMALCRKKTALLAMYEPKPAVDACPPFTEYSSRRALVPSLLTVLCVLLLANLSPRSELPKRGPVEPKPRDEREVIAEAILELQQLRPDAKEVFAGAENWRPGDDLFHKVVKMQMAAEDANRRSRELLRALEIQDEMQILQLRAMRSLVLPEPNWGLLHLTRDPIKLSPEEAAFRDNLFTRRAETEANDLLIAAAVGPLWFMSSTSVDANGAAVGCHHVPAVAAAEPDGWKADVIKYGLTPTTQYGFSSLEVLQRSLQQVQGNSAPVDPQIVPPAR